jgi:hypothetical protein
MAEPVREIVSVGDGGSAGSGPALAAAPVASANAHTTAAVVTARTTPTPDRDFMTAPRRDADAQQLLCADGEV